MTIEHTQTRAHGSTQEQASFRGLEGAIARHQDVLLLVGRLALAYLFIESAINHATNLTGFAATFNNFQLPEPLGFLRQRLPCWWNCWAESHWSWVTASARRRSC